MRRVMAARDVRVHLADLTYSLGLARLTVKLGPIRVSPVRLQLHGPKVRSEMRLMAKQCKAELLDTLRTLLREALTLRHEGAAHPKVTRTSALVDGYMRALLDAGLATQAELLTLVSEERTRVSGPGTGRASDPAFLAA